MANGHGGQRTPASPAPASGPGAMSQRTDGGPGQPARYMAGGNYGDGQEMMGLQQAAPLAASPQTQGQRVTPQRAATPPTGLVAPSERPNEPVPEGARFAPGNGQTVLSGGLGTTKQANSQDAMALKSYMPALVRMANTPGTPTSFVRFVSYLRTL